MNDELFSFLLQSICQNKTKFIRVGKQDNNKKETEVEINRDWCMTYGFVSLLSIGEIHCRASGSTKPCIASDGNDSSKLSCKLYVQKWTSDILLYLQIEMLS